MFYIAADHLREMQTQCSSLGFPSLGGDLQKLPELVARELNLKRWAGFWQVDVIVKGAKVPEQSCGALAAWGRFCFDWAVLLKPWGPAMPHSCRSTRTADSGSLCKLGT